MVQTETDMRADEQKRGVAIKSTVVSPYLEHDEDDGKGPTLYLCDSVHLSGHVGFSLEVRAALSIIDGVVVVVSCIDSLTGKAVIVEAKASGEVRVFLRAGGQQEGLTYIVEGISETETSRSLKVISHCEICLRDAATED